MKKILMLAGLTAAIGMSGTAVRADDLSTTLAQQFYPGHGDTQSFVINYDSTNKIQLGLAAQPRGVSAPPVVQIGDTYFVQPGGTGGDALWNFDFVIDTNPTDGISSQQLSKLTATLTVSGPVSGSFNPLSSDLGNNGNSSPNTLAQNSENLGFGSVFSSPVGTGSPLGFNPNLPGIYTFTLSITATPLRGGGAAFTDTDTINVDVVPLPSAAGMGLGMLGLIGAAGLLRKKLRTA